MTEDDMIRHRQASWDGAPELTNEQRDTVRRFGIHPEDAPAQYVPTTEEIREYVEVGGEPRPWMPPEPEKEAARAAAFDRWLIAHDAETRRKVLDPDAILSALDGHQKRDYIAGAWPEGPWAGNAWVCECGHRLEPVDPIGIPAGVSALDWWHRAHLADVFRAFAEGGEKR